MSARNDNTPGALLGTPEDRPGIAGTAYDTAWLAGVAVDHDPYEPAFPASLQWLMEHQLPDSSWGGVVRYEHDRILCTLAALASLATFDTFLDSHAAIAAGTRYLWQHGHLLACEPAELVGFELLLPALVQRAQQAGIMVPPHLDIYAAQRAKKLQLIPRKALYSPQVTVVHSLEFLGGQAELAGLRAAQGANGSIGNSPAATAFYFAQSREPQAYDYLRRCLARTGGAMVPVLYPCERFELLWAAYHLSLVGVSACRLLTPVERRLLADALGEGGVSLSASFPIPDADDTAVALLLLHQLGEAVDPGVLQRFAISSDSCFASFPHERHSSVGVNLHALHTIVDVPGYPDRIGTITRVLDYLEAQQIHGLYWVDKWHISPYYATAHALCVMRGLPTEFVARMEPALDRSREWIRQTQNGDGSWGFYGQPTAEETAYGLLAVASGNNEVSTADRRRCAAAVAYLEAAGVMDDRDGLYDFPPLWIDKCLYTPTLVVRAVIAAAGIVAAQLAESDTWDECDEKLARA
jgi:halimadienyl-diphosphate synthase